MEILLKLKKCQLLAINIIEIVILFFLTSCSSHNDGNDNKVNCLSLPNEIKVINLKDTLINGEKYYGQVIFNEKLKSGIKARIYVQGQEIYFNRDTTLFEFYPKDKGRNTIEAKFKFKYKECLDTTIYRKVDYVVKPSP